MTTHRSPGRLPSVGFFGVSQLFRSVPVSATGRLHRLARLSSWKRIDIFSVPVTGRITAVIEIARYAGIEPRLTDE